MPSGQAGTQVVMPPLLRSIDLDAMLPESVLRLVRGLVIE